MLQVQGVWGGVKRFAALEFYWVWGFAVQDPVSKVGRTPPGCFRVASAPFGAICSMQEIGGIGEGVGAVQSSSLDDARASTERETRETRKGSSVLLEQADAIDAAHIVAAALQKEQTGRIKRQAVDACKGPREAGHSMRKQQKREESARRCHSRLGIGQQTSKFQRRKPRTIKPDKHSRCCCRQQPRIPNPPSPNSPIPRIAT